MLDIYFLRDIIQADKTNPLQEPQMRKIVYRLYNWVDMSPFSYNVQGEYGEEDEVIYDYEDYSTMEEAENAIPPEVGKDVIIMAVSTII